MSIAPPLFEGTFAVIPGCGEARRLGFRTLNFDLSHTQLPVDHGIYAGWIEIDGVRHRAAIHYGPRPVLDDPDPSLEAHLIDVELDAAPSRVAIELTHYLRAIRDFPTTDALVVQITADVAQARSLLGDRP